MSYSALFDFPERGCLPRAVRRVLPAAVALSLVLGLPGCMTAKIEENRQAATNIASNEAVVLLAKPHLEGAGTENAFLDCLERELVGRKISAEAQTAQEAGKKIDPRSNLADKPFQIYADGEFVDALYPWLEPSTAPANADGLSALLARPGVGERVSAMGVRYIIWIDGATKKTDGGGSVACGAGPGGAGCIGLGWWEKQSDYQATVWDLRDKIGVGDVTTAVSGTSVFIGAIAPIPIIMPVQNTACDRMAAQIKSFLIGEGQDAVN